MNLLLDTHALLWWHEAAPSLSKPAFDALNDPGNTVYFSVVNIWEAQIKQQLGKLTVTDPLPKLVNQQHQVNGFGLLSVRVEHVYELDTLPLHHKDPFDRLLIAQAIHEGLTLVSRDPEMKPYGVSLLW